MNPHARIRNDRENLGTVAAELTTAAERDCVWAGRVNSVSNSSRPASRLGGSVCRTRSGLRGAGLRNRG